MILLLIFVGLLGVIVAIPQMIRAGIRRFAASIRFRKKFVKAGIFIAYTPLAILSMMLLIGGTDFILVLFTIIVPFMIPALLSGGCIGYFLGGKVLGPTPIEMYKESKYYQNNQRYYYSDLNNYDDPNIFDTTCRYVEEDHQGEIKEMLWRANNPQPKDLPSIMLK